MEKSRVTNINTKNYWENRFGAGDWEDKGGRTQTASFAKAQVRYFRIKKNFKGLLLDFGCGLGDAIPIYRHFYPDAQLMGLDVSESAIEKCITTYGHLATFTHGTHNECPNADVIVASNVFEHLTDDIAVAKKLLSKCHQLYITVPYKEWPLCSEHIRTYDENYFKPLGEYEYIIFPSRGWSEYGWSLIKLRIKNIVAAILGKEFRSRNMQIMYCFNALGMVSKTHH